MSKIQEALYKKFQEHRVIFWYDEKEELLNQFNTLDLLNIEKIHIDNNEFEVKYTVTKEKPKSKFLLYFTGEKPIHEENWLLDLELAHHVFHTDQEAMFLQEIGLDYHFKELVSEHIEFFKAKERRNKLKDLLGAGDSHQEIRYKMLAVVFAAENISLVTFIHAFGTAFIEEKDHIEKDLDRFNLSSYFWKEVSRKYNYQNETPSIYDFLMEVFSNNFILGKKTGLAKESKLLLSLWKDTLKYRHSFGEISDKIADDLNMEDKLNQIPIEEIIEEDLFQLTDKKMIHELVHLVVSETIPNDKVNQWVKKRENKFWYNEYLDFYQSIIYASEMITLVKKYAKTNYETFEEGVQSYSSNLYRIDQQYRKFIWTYRKCNQNKILAALAEKVEKIYDNDWLLSYNNNWQAIIDNLEKWPAKDKHSQQQFFNQHVKPFTDKKQRLFVIISDALRYECGAELSKRLKQENRYESSVDYMVSSLPSYTQLGMASLLPHKELAFKEGSDHIMVDDMTGTGTKGRAKILEMNSGVRATAIKAKDFMQMNSAIEGRDFVKQYDLIYIFHNRIDKTGDDKTSEEKVFEAVEDELVFLMDMMKKIANVNGNNMIVTADHGFIYQHKDLLESDYLVSNYKGDIIKENRRFVIGKGLTSDNATKKFNGKQLNIASDVDILIPKSINRIRIKGAGSKFVHGGASMQEVIIPLIKITKKRKDTTSQVDIDIIKSTDKITTNILAISFIQSDLVSDTVLSRTIRAAIYAEDGVLLSNHFKYIFDIEEGSERQREIKHRFQLSSKASGQYKSQQVKLILEEPVEGSSKWKTYKEYHYTLNISFTNDFDDF